MPPLGPRVDGMKKTGFEIPFSLFVRYNKQKREGALFSSDGEEEGQWAAKASRRRRRHAAAIGSDSDGARYALPFSVTPLLLSFSYLFIFSSGLGASTKGARCDELGRGFGFLVVGDAVGVGVGVFGLKGKATDGRRVDGGSG